MYVHFSRIHNKAGDRFLRQIEAYNDNEVDVAVLLEDSQMRDVLQQEKEQAESDLIILQTRTATLQAEYESKLSQLQQNMQALELKCQDLELGRFSTVDKNRQLTSTLSCLLTVVSKFEKTKVPFVI
ncbi:unnamed protein product [Trichobilharzia regenti]|nr:unnamed protein product [Trichobilharzia regenti]